MYRKLARVIGSVAAAALLAVSMSACGGEAEKPKPKPSTEESKPAEEGKKEGKAEGATEVAYKCAKEGCDKTKSAAAGAAAPQC